MWAIRAVHLSKRAFLLAQAEAEKAESERNKRPNLHLVIDGQRGTADTIINVAATDSQASDFVLVTIENDGDRPARNIVLDLRLPDGVTDDSIFQRLLDDVESDFGEAVPFIYRPEGGGKRAVKSIPGILLPNTIPAEAGTLYFRAKPGLYGLSWFITSEEGTWSGVFRLGVRTYDD